MNVILFLLSLFLLGYSRVNIVGDNNDNIYSTITLTQEFQPLFSYHYYTGLVHFIKTAEIADMIPAWVPERILLLQLTGFFEFALAIGFLTHQTITISGWLAIITLILFPSWLISTSQLIICPWLQARLAQYACLFDHLYSYL